MKDNHQLDKLWAMLKQSPLHVTDQYAALDGGSDPEIYVGDIGMPGPYKPRHADPTNAVNQQRPRNYRPRHRRAG
jgi:hypothetical protein